MSDRFPDLIFRKICHYFRLFTTEYKDYTQNAAVVT